MVTIKDVAAKANVSLTTASMVLNNKTGVVRISDKTKRHVLEVAAALGYVPNLSARQLRRSGDNTLTLALLLPVDSRVAMMGEMVNGIQQYLTSEETPMPCTFVVETYKSGRMDTVKGLIQPNRFNGAIVANLSPADQQFLHSEPSKVPCVLLQRQSDMYSCVDADNVTAGREMARHFIRNGHRQLVVLVPSLSSDAVSRRVYGMELELSESAPGPVELVRKPCDFSEHSGYAAVKELLAEIARPTAILCLSDATAVGVLSALHDEGISVPDQCEVMGCDNLSVSRYTIPKLSTIEVPVGRMAYEAAKVLVNQIVQPNAPIRTTTFEMSVIHRETTRFISAD